jgi:hypothetical protein
MSTQDYVLARARVRLISMQVKASCRLHDSLPFGVIYCMKLFIVATVCYYGLKSLNNGTSCVCTLFLHFNYCFSTGIDYVYIFGT